MTGKSNLFKDAVSNISRPFARALSQWGRTAGSAAGEREVTEAAGTGEQLAAAEDTPRGDDRMQRGMTTRKSKLVVNLVHDKKNDRTKMKRNAFEVLTNKADVSEQPTKCKKSAATVTKAAEVGVGRAFGVIRSRQNGGSSTASSRLFILLETINKALVKRRKTNRKACVPVVCELQAVEIDALCSLKELSSAVDDILLHRPPDGVTDIDANVNHFRCPEYAWDMIDYLLRMDEKFTLQNGIIFESEELNANVRAVLVDWLIQVQDHLQTHQETLHLCISMLDDFLSRQRVSLSRVQLLGITCLFVACKFEERFCPSINKLIRLTDDTYTYDQVIKMEIVVLRVLNFRLSRPTPTVFLDRVLASHEHNKKIDQLARYLLDLSLCDIHCVGHLSSLKAAASVYVARRVLIDAGEVPDDETTIAWTRSLEFYSTFTESDMSPVVVRFAKLLLRAEKSKFQGARNKYTSQSRFGVISQWPAANDSDMLRTLASMPPSRRDTESSAGSAVQVFASL